MNYKETTITGTSWTRCKSVTISNPYPGNGNVNIITGIESKPSAQFQEEQVLSLPDKNLFSDSGYCSKEFNPVTSFALLDTVTGNPTGAMATHEQLYQMLYSLYIATATERDNGHSTTIT